MGIRDYVEVNNAQQWIDVVSELIDQDYQWIGGGNEIHSEYFASGSRFVGFDQINKTIARADSDFQKMPYSYGDFMGTSEIETVFVTVEQFKAIKISDSETYKAHKSLGNRGLRLETEIIDVIDEDKLRKIGRYILGDPNIKLVVQEELYRLVGKDWNGLEIFYYNHDGIPNWTRNPLIAFTGKKELIKQYETPDWKMERAN
ncbi:MAG: hypothetical protein WBP82_06875 [Leuconostoc mesenteroides]